MAPSPVNQYRVVFIFVVINVLIIVFVSMELYLPQTSENVASSAFGRTPGRVFLDAESPHQEESCGYSVMMRTTDSGEYIEEVVSYYIVHQASKIHILDYSSGSEVRQILQPFIEQGFVRYEKSPEPFKYETQAISIHSWAMKIIKSLFHSSGHFWLLSVDDDEFVLPSPRKLTQRRKVREIVAHEGMTIRNFLCSEEVLDYKSVRFRWRFVGTNGIPNRAAKGERLDIESYTQMQKHIMSQYWIGKSAFHIVGLGISIETWDTQGEGVSGVKNPRREGGPYFMHGNIKPGSKKVNGIVVSTSPWLGDFALLEYGFTFHFSRSKEELSKRITRWSKEKVVKVKTVEANHKKDNNEESCVDLYIWTNKVSYVMNMITSGIPFTAENVSSIAFKEV